jgi:thermitase
VPVESAPIPIRTAIQFAARQRIVLIASAGNKNTNSLPPYPASDNLRVIAVAATDPADVKADFSNYGLYIDVCAPGVNIYSAYPEGRFAWGSGTSFAVPFVSGSAALVLSTGDSNAGQAVEETAIPIDHLNPSFRGLLGWGRIDARAAVSH